MTEYITKIWFIHPTTRDTIIKKLNLINRSIYTEPYDLIIGNYIFRNNFILLFIHVSWGSLDSIQKIKIYSYGLDDDDIEALTKEIIEKFDELIIY